MENTISLEKLKQNNLILKDQNPKSYRLIKDNILLARYIRENETIVIKIYDGPFISHTIDPRIQTLNAKGKVLKSLSQTVETYDEYLKYLKERFKKRQLFIKV